MHWHGENRRGFPKENINHKLYHGLPYTYEVSYFKLD